jgi:hypothetical protein
VNSAQVPGDGFLDGLIVWVELEVNVAAAQVKGERRAIAIDEECGVGIGGRFAHQRKRILAPLEEPRTRAELD